jgi:hypothetical protein
MMADFQNNFICGRKFQCIADFIRDTNRPINYSKLKNKSIIWCKVDFVKEFFVNVTRCSGEYILITHNGDWPITKNIFESKPPCVRKWFAQNVDYLHKDLIPLPIGLENDEGPSKGAYTDYIALEKNLNKPKDNVDKIYCNFNVNNYSSRTETLNILMQNDIGVLDIRHDYPTYCSNMSHYQFVASPRGNGIDCHRTWEALYLGCFPIVEKHLMYNIYCDLPIIQISKWGDINKRWLKNKHEELLNREIDYSQLKISYWFDKILKERDAL